MFGRRDRSDDRQALVERMYQAKSALDGAEALQRAYSQLEEITTDLDNSGLSQQLFSITRLNCQRSQQTGLCENLLFFKAIHSHPTFVVLTMLCSSGGNCGMANWPT